MRLNARFAPLLAAALVAGCAHHRPVVDTRSVADPQQYEKDLAECQSFAQQIDPGVPAALGAVVGGILGAALGVVTDDPWTGAYAAAGAIGGLVGGGAKGASNQRDVIRNCMLGRNYAVLD
ncbi:hypothetical protein [Thauera aromatica]|uniref:hypothetical protein n=1 Tax=Thauera aromatica TaxID=59405 RepID=UPI001FFC8C92|nr:hypothetical protein [Thauera aromatica]MCK2097549.1 hypothetical protein [Thauera aromatica]